MSLRRKMRRRQDVTAKTRYTGRCPGCNAEVTLAKVTEEDGGEEMVLHPMPYCNYFIHTEAEEYAREAFPQALN